MYYKDADGREVFSFLTAVREYLRHEEGIREKRLILVTDSLMGPPLAPEFLIEDLTGKRYGVYEAPAGIPTGVVQTEDQFRYLQQQSEAFPNGVPEERLEILRTERKDLFPISEVAKDEERPPVPNSEPSDTVEDLVKNAQKTMNALDEDPHANAAVQGQGEFVPGAEVPAPEEDTKRKGKKGKKSDTGEGVEASQG